MLRIPNPFVCLLALSVPLSSQTETSPPASHSGYEDVPEFGGAISVGKQLKVDDEVKETAFRFDSIQRGLKPYFDWKTRLKKEYGLSLGMDYTALYFGASDALPGMSDTAGSGDFRLFGNWTLVDEGDGNTGSLVFKGENRHAYGSQPVSGLGFASGYVGLLGPPFNDREWMITNFYWQHKAMGGDVTFNLGLVDATDYVDIYGLISPWLHFSNLVFSTGGSAMAIPDQGLGAAVGTRFDENLYLIAGITDANGDPTDFGQNFETFFDDAEYFKHIELGWTTAPEEAYVNNAHVTLWHVDSREAAGTPDGWGVNASAGYLLESGLYPFLRGGYSDDGGALLESSLSVGCGYHMPYRNDVLGLGLNWGRPGDGFGPSPSDQYTTELFYRIQLSQNFALTPDIQWVIDPALNPSQESLLYFGLRARLSL